MGDCLGIICQYLDVSSMRQKYTLTQLIPVKLVNRGWVLTFAFDESDWLAFQSRRLISNDS